MRLTTEEAEYLRRILRHELAHCVIGARYGHAPVDVVSDKHEDAANCIVPPIAFSRFSTPNVIGPDGNEIEGLIDCDWRHSLESLMAGAAADRIYSGIDLLDETGRLNNHEAIGDIRLAQNIMRILGFSKQDGDETIIEAYLSVMEPLAEDRVATAILAAAETREPGLPETHHFSKSRLKRICDEANRN